VIPIFCIYFIRLLQKSDDFCKSLINIAQFRIIANLTKKTGRTKTYYARKVSIGTLPSVDKAIKLTGPAP
jgi:hypothetical protein